MDLKHTYSGLGGDAGAIQPLAGNVTEYLETKISVKVVCLREGRAGERNRGEGRREERREEGDFWKALCLP